MCGRFAFHAGREEVLAHFDLGAAPALPARYNIAPQSAIAAVRDDGLALLRWGLVPFWAKDPKLGYRMINARAETVAGKPAFRAAFKHRRCLIPASGFYEWRRVAGATQPYYIRLRDGDLFAFAGLWEHWDGRGEHAGTVIESCTILTTEPNALCATIHDRMPVIVAPADYARWLAEPAAGLLRPFPAERMQAYPVSRAVNDAQHDGPQLIARQAD